MGDEGQGRDLGRLALAAHHDGELLAGLGQGWFFKVKLADVSETEGLMDETAYDEFAKNA